MSAAKSKCKLDPKIYVTVAPACHVIVYTLVVRLKSQTSHFLLHTNDMIDKTRRKTKHKQVRIRESLS